MTHTPIDEKQLMALWTSHASGVFAYILTLEPNWANAEDIFQETGVTVWEKRADFSPGSDFRSWACRIAYFKMLSFVRDRRPLDTLGQQLLDTLSAESQELAVDLEPRLQALTSCLDKLSPRNRQILELRYGSNGTAKHVAEVMKLSIVGAYKALQRIHESLFRCIQRELTRENR
jgi:RNA polymerase sigma-70 factor (ECF subfamily)